VKDSGPTGYVYGVTRGAGGSDIYSNDLLSAIQCPDKTTGNRCGQEHQEPFSFMLTNPASFPKPPRRIQNDWKKIFAEESRREVGGVTPSGPQGGPKGKSSRFFPKILPLWANCPSWPEGGIRGKNA
jgi:hypothetical protein